MLDEKTTNSDIIVILVGCVQLCTGFILWLVKGAVKASDDRYKLDRDNYKSDKQDFCQEIKIQECHIEALYSKVNSALTVISAHDETVDNLKDIIKEMKEDCRHNREKGVHQ